MLRLKCDCQNECGVVNNSVWTCPTIVYRFTVLGIRRCVSLQRKQLSMLRQERFDWYAKDRSDLLAAVQNGKRESHEPQSTTRAKIANALLMIYSSE